MVMRSNTMLFTDTIIHYGRRKSKRTADVLRSWENLHNYRYTEYGCKRKKYCELLYSIGKITHVGKMKKKMQSLHTAAADSKYPIGMA